MLTAASLCTDSPWTPRLGIQLGGFDPDPPCAPILGRGSTGVGSEEPRTRRFWVHRNDREMFKGCWVCMSMIWLVDETPRFRNPCSGFGLNLNLEPGIQVDFEFAVQK